MHFSVSKVEWRLNIELISKHFTLLSFTFKGKRRRQSTRLEHLGIPEEELLRQQQELFAKARAEQETIEQEEWIKMQSEAIQQFESNAKVRLSTSFKSL